jgi:phage-related tail protein
MKLHGSGSMYTRAKYHFKYLEEALKDNNIPLIIACAYRAGKQMGMLKGKAVGKQHKFPVEYRQITNNIGELQTIYYNILVTSKK